LACGRWLSGRHRAGAARSLLGGGGPADHRARSESVAEEDAAEARADLRPRVIPDRIPTRSGARALARKTSHGWARTSLLLSLAAHGCCGTLAHYTRDLGEAPGERRHPGPALGRDCRLHQLRVRDPEPSLLSADGDDTIHCLSTFSGSPQS